MGGKILRVTLFKIPEKDHQLQLAETYKKLSTDAVKDGKPYILSLQAGPTIEGSPSGFTFVAKTEFASLEDMKYYDEEDPVHLALKKSAFQLNIQEILITYTEPLVVL